MRWPGLEPVEEGLHGCRLRHLGLGFRAQGFRVLEFRVLGFRDLSGMLFELALEYWLGFDAKKRRHVSNNELLRFMDDILRQPAHYVPSLGYTPEKKI